MIERIKDLMVSLQLATLSQINMDIDLRDEVRVRQICLQFGDKVVKILSTKSTKMQEYYLRMLEAQAALMSMPEFAASTQEIAVALAESLGRIPND